MAEKSILLNKNERSCGMPAEKEACVTADERRKAILETLKTSDRPCNAIADLIFCAEYLSGNVRSA